MTDTAPLAMSIIEAVRLAGVSRSSLYLAIGRGEITIRKAGRRSLILHDDLRAWLDRLPAAPSATAHQS